MRRQCYLIFNANGITRISGTGKRGARTVPSLRGGEFAVKIVLEVPDSLFRKDTPTALIQVPPRDVVHPYVEVVPVAATEGGHDGE